MYHDFVINVIEVLLLCGFVIWINLSLNKKYSRYILGVMFGLITVFVISERIMIVGDRYFDFRHITMTMAGFIGGPVTAVIAALISSLYRYYFSGNGSMGGITNIIVFACFGIILGRNLRSSQNGKKVWFWFIIGICMACILLFIISFFDILNNSSLMVLRIVAIPFFILTPLATTIIFNFYFWIYNFCGKASILNTIINDSPINLIIFNAYEPILVSKTLRKQPLVCQNIESLFPLQDTDKTWITTTKQQRKEIETEDERQLVADLASFQMPNGEYACVAIVNDITDRKREQEKLKVAKERFAKVFQFAPHMMTIIRKSDYRYVDVNRRFLEERGFEYEEVIGKTPTEIGMSDREFKMISEIFKEKGSVQNIECSLVTKHGSEGTAIISAEKIQINDQECVLIATNNITEMKRMQTEIARLDRLNLVGQLSAGIAHEIRNPMTTVRGYLQLLGRKPDYLAQKSTFELMISELDRANAIITEFLSLAQLKQTELKYQNLNDILDNLYPLLEADSYTQNKQISFIQGVIPNLKLNSNEISQMILNLVRNGLESMEERGSLTIKSCVEGDEVVLSIEDEGCGIPKENLNKLGTPFFTTKDFGTGLGLATSYKIAESHNAKIHINSSSSGTTFCILFPIPEQEQGEMIA
ncbi:ATP-binding protein [Desulfosporosinus sp. Sb-LF]|uniref:ATP-binding protein n=1 Tax=Desulfosporosinus sp. Sb-LF TaxID=2560027 RepID=UPI00107FBDC1|nr:ATP-binding protein [Desulfosporosinus sp. Sb-LF]TGE34477.1 PAS domain S-box protein [Desulfosporosinus sp. Sb-LF]